MTNIRLIFRSGWMVGGIACEILAVIAAAGNWFAGSGPVWQLLPNAALTLATLGAVLVASKIALDYHGRGLNGKQQEDVNEILSNSSLNTTQEEEVAQAINSSELNPHQREAVNEILLNSSLNEVQKDAVAQIIAESGLSPRQVSDLPAKLMDIYLWPMISAQRAAVIAADYLRQKGHGRVAVLTNAGDGLVEVQCIDPPQEALNCKRQHGHEEGNSSSPLEIAVAHLQSLAGDTVIWLPPAGNELRYANVNSHPTMSSYGRRWVFSFEDCVPKLLDPIADYYVLIRDDSGVYAWVQKS